MTNNPAFKYFQDRDHLVRVQSDPFQMEGRRKLSLRPEDDLGTTSVKMFSTMPKRHTSATNDSRSTRSSSSISNNKIHIISGASMNGKNGRGSGQKPPSVTDGSTGRCDVANGNHSESSSGVETDKSMMDVAQLIRHHNDEIQTNSQWKRFSGNDRCRWFFRSLRGERVPKSSDELSGSEFRAAECSRCRLASLTANQLEARIEALQSSVAEKTLQLERMSIEMAKKEKNLLELESSFSRLTLENNELKASINRRISEEIFGKRVLLTPDLDLGRVQDQRSSSNKLQYSSSLRFNERHFSQPSLTLLSDLHNGGHYEKQDHGRGVDSSQIFRNDGSAAPPGARMLTSIRSVGDDDEDYEEVNYDEEDDNADDEASAFVPLDKSRRYYPGQNHQPFTSIKPKPILTRPLEPPQPPPHRRVGQISITDREWHSTEGVATAPRVATARASAASAVVDVCGCIGEGKRSAKSSLELDDSLCVEYPNRTFKQQMECLGTAIQSVDSLKSEPLGRKFKTRRRRETVATLLGGNASSVSNSKDKITTNSKFQVSSTRKLSSYSVEQHQQKQYPQQFKQTHFSRGCISESGPTTPRVGQLIKASSTDLLYHSPDFIQPRRLQVPQERHQLQLSQRLEFDPRNYYLQGDRNNNNNNSSGNYSRNSGDKYIDEIAQLTDTIARLEKNRANEKRSWSEEKMKVIEYQKRLQDAYLSVSSHCKRLENDLIQIKNLPRAD